MENSLFLGVPKFRQSTASLQSAWILGPLKNINFPFETNGKLMILGVPILKHFRVSITPILGWPLMLYFKISFFFVHSFWRIKKLNILCSLTVSFENWMLLLKGKILLPLEHFFIFRVEAIRGVNASGHGLSFLKLYLFTLRRMSIFS